MSDDTIDITPKHETTALTKGYTPTSLDEYARVGKLAAASRLCGVTSVEDATVMLLTGAELGLGPMQSLRGIHVVQGKPVMSADMLAAVCLASPACIYMYPKHMDATSCTYVTHRRGMPEPVEMTYSMEDAKRAGLTGKDVWRKHPQAMLKARCVAQMARAIYPDLCLGVYVEDEAREMQGEYERATVKEVADLNKVQARLLEAGLPEEMADEVITQCMTMLHAKGMDEATSRNALARRVHGLALEDIPGWASKTLEEAA